MTHKYPPAILFLGLLSLYGCASSIAEKTGGDPADGPDVVVGLPYYADLVGGANHDWSTHGVYLTRTTVDDLAAAGREVEDGTGAYRGKRVCRIDDVTYVIDDNGIVRSASVRPHSRDALPEEWKRQGLTEGMDYGDWLEWLGEQTGTYRLDAPPHRKMWLHQGQYGTWDFAGFRAYLSGHPELILDVYFSDTHRGSDPAGDIDFGPAMKIELEEAVSDAAFLHTPYPNNEKVTLPEKKRHALGMAGILAEINRSDMETLNVGYLGGSQDNWLKMLKRDWGHESREDLIRSRNNLIAGGHSDAWDYYRTLLQNAPEGGAAQIIRQEELQPYQIARLALVEEFLPRVGTRQIDAWDLGRSIALVRWGYQVGWLEEDEAWRMIMESAELAWDIYASWEDFAADYMLGRMFWSPSGFLERGNAVIEAVNTLMLTENSVWADDSLWRGSSEGAMSRRDMLYLPAGRGLASLRLEEAWDEFNEEHVDEAFDLLEEAGRLSENPMEMMYQKGIMLYRLSEYDTVIDLMRQYQDSIADDFRSWHLLGSAYMENNSIGNAEMALGQGLEINPDHAGLRDSRGLLYIRTSRFDQAATDFRRLLSLYSAEESHEEANLHYANYAVGYCLFQLNDSEAALDHLETAYPSYTESGYVNLMLGVCYRNQGSEDSAEACFRKAADLGMNLPGDVVQWLADME